MALSGVLERSGAPTPHRLVAPPEAEEPAAPIADLEAPEPGVEPAQVSRGRGGRAPKAAAPRPAKKIPGRTLYINDDLWERIIVQAHRKRKTYSEYVESILERQVPDHRVVRAGGSAAGEPGEG
jgi:hypothetical protein